MKPVRAIAIASAALLLSAGVALAQSWQPPSDSQRCPSKWGPADERGAANLMSRETVLRAARLIKTGEVIELGHVLSAAMPLSAGRRFEIDTKRTTINPQSNRRGSNEELVVAEIGQVGTQFDGFAHQTIGNSLYNCFKVDEVSTRTGFTKLGIQNVGALVTRGVLIDVAALKNVEMLTDTYEITLQDVQQALAREKLTLADRRRRDRPHRMGQALGQGRPALLEGQSRHWHRRRRVAGTPEPDPGWRRHAAGRGVTEPRSAGVAAHPSDDAGRQRHPSAGEPEARRARGEAGVRVRAHRRAAEDPGSAPDPRSRRSPFGDES